MEISCGYYYNRQKSIKINDFHLKNVGKNVFFRDAAQFSAVVIT